MNFEINPSLIIKCNDQLTVENVNDAIELCKELTKTYDESHDYQHHVQVLKNAIDILNELDEIHNHELLLRLIFYTAILHDTIDYKYPEGLEDKIKMVKEFLDNHVPSEAESIQWIINNMSYSKEKKNGYPVHSDPVIQLARDIVSDADKLEAIGQIGVIRCKQFTIASNPTASEEAITNLVIQHCHDKLLTLKDSYIRTTPGMKLAEPKHSVIEEYVQKFSQKID